MAEFEATGVEGGLSFTPGSEESQASEGTPLKDSGPKEETQETAPPDEKQEAPQEDPEVTLPDGSAVKWSDVQKWKSGHMMQADYTRKTKEVAETRRTLESERQQFMRERQAAEEGFKRVMENPQEYARMRAARGLAVGTIDPHTNGDQWMQVRYQQYLQGGREAEATREQLQYDLMDHKLQIQRDRFDQMQQATETATRQAADQQEALRFERTLVSLKAKYKAADTAVGQEMIEGFVAREINRGNESPDLEAIVKRVAEIQGEVLKQYAGKKADQARSVSGITRGRGQPRASDTKDYGGEISSFREMAEDRIRRG